MNNKIFLTILVIGAIVVGYMAGKTQNDQRIPNILQTPAQSVLPVASLSHNSHNIGESLSESRIPGADHIHAITFDAQGNLLSSIL